MQSELEEPEFFLEQDFDNPFTGIYQFEQRHFFGNTYVLQNRLEHGSLVNAIEQIKHLDEKSVSKGFEMEENLDSEESHVQTKLMIILGKNIYQKEFIAYNMIHVSSHVYNLVISKGILPFEFLNDIETNLNKFLELFKENETFSELIFDIQDTASFNLHTLMTDHECHMKQNNILERADSLLLFKKIGSSLFGLKNDDKAQKNGKTTSKFLSNFSNKKSKYLFTGDDNGHLKQWDVERGRLQKDYGKVHSSSITAIAVLSDGTSMYTSDSKGVIKQWCLKKFKILASIEKKHTDRVFSIVVTYDCHWLLSSDIKGRILKWAIQQNNKLVKIFKTGQTGIHSIAVMYNNKYFFTSDYHSNFRQYNFETFELVKNFGEIFHDSIYSVVCTPDNKWFITSDHGGNIKQWNVNTSNIHHIFPNQHNTTIYSICVSPDSRWLFTSDKNGNIKQWEIESGKCFKWPEKAHDGCILSVDCSPDNKFLFSSDSGGNFKQWSIEKDIKLVKPFYKKHDTDILSIAVTT